MRPIFTFGSLVLLALLSTGARPEQPESKDVASPAEIQARANLAKSFPGEIVFDSTRGDGFGIHIINLASGEIRTLVDTDKEEMYPNVSPDGKWVAFSRANSKNKRDTADIFLIPATGGAEQKLASDGTFPTFSADGKSIYFERDRNHIIQIDLQTKQEQEIFPKGRPEWAELSVVKPHVSPNDKLVSFISEKPRRWSSWYAELETGKATFVGPGCEPTWFSNSEKIAWVSGVKAKERSGIAAYDIRTKKVSMVQDADAPRGHEYFPSLELKDKFLLYGAARPKEHKPTTANYQIFAKNIATGQVVRVTFDKYTNRWPKLLPFAK